MGLPWTRKQSLRAPCAGAETTAAGVAETGPWFATALDVYAAEIGLLDTGPGGAGIGVREVTTADVRRWCTEASGPFRLPAPAVLVSGGRIDPISSPAPAIVIGHPRPPGMASASHGM
jgi:hypothetical protein